MEVKKEKPEIKQWHVIYTKSKWEKKVDNLLLQQGFDSWCPVEKKERFWTDRKKIIEVLQRLAERGTTVVVVAHSTETELTWADKVIKQFH